MNIEHDRSDVAAGEIRRAEQQAAERASTLRAGAARSGATRLLLLPGSMGGPSFAKAFEIAGPMSNESRAGRWPDAAATRFMGAGEQLLQRERTVPGRASEVAPVLDAEAGRSSSNAASEATVGVDSVATQMLADLLAVRPVGPSLKRAEGRSKERSLDDVEAVATDAESGEFAKAGITTKPVAAPPPVKLVPPEVLDAVVRFATFTRTGDGHAQFVVGLKQGLLGGGSIRVTSLGDRRVSLQVRGTGGSVGADELAGLLASLRKQRIEVVEVDVDS